MKIYTKTGDAGQTSLIGARVDKDDLRIEAYGTIDQLNSQINVIMSLTNTYDYELIRISNYLFSVGHDLAQTDTSKYKVIAAEIQWLETAIDELVKKTGEFDYFTLPGGTLVASNLHVARTICRSAERKIITAHKKFATNEFVLAYVNRLSDYLYTLACYENKQNNTKLIPVKFT